MEPGTGGMDDSFLSKLRLWDGFPLAAPVVAQGVQESPASRTLPGPHYPAAFADQLYAHEALNPPLPSPRAEEGTEPYTLQWFLDIENQRHSRQGRWIPRVLEFARHAGETLLGLGNGLGTDWLQYARHGAAVVVCSPSASQLSLIRRNFELRGLTGRFLHAQPASLPLESSAIDVVCVSSLLHEVDNRRAVVEEIYRVLKPGGKVLAVTPARYDVDFWARLLLPWRRWWVPGGRSTDLAACFSRRELRRLFGRFVEHRVYKRHLRRSELPHLWRWLPISLLERLVGRVLVLKAFKPLSAAKAVQLAA
jgi:SAM-dependent methyltransferase